MVKILGADTLAHCTFRLRRLAVSSLLKLLIGVSLTLVALAHNAVVHIIVVS